ncbi:hypothetical protein OEW28_00930 [Defluviimonas sp. WL0002]|uniref:PH domain-containing protein n=1 Tax=Albidovulum marisflavi TaxID=2984159 RepID=A0ABT2Z7Q9_9RHOB|nr:hypothetical protein [Defluviimonas sp. WL0002]MCV2867189.1 hypothetical protein [Defluviimonas sp. WL0002]
MSFIRPELQKGLWRWREVLFAAGLVAVALWITRLGGYVFIPLGLVLGALGLGWGAVAVRRLRFARTVDAPGMVEIDEGQIGYLGPTFGGYVALRELTEIRLIDIHGKRHWRLRQADGQVLLIPIAAAGADRLHDAFAALPGIDLGALSRALDAREGTEILWQRSAHAALT